MADPDPFALPQTTSTPRERTELYLPLIFYLFAWLTFFMTIPRSWNAIQLQRSPDQTLARAKPSATDARFKAGSVLAVVCVFLIIYSLQHSIYQYKPRSKTSWVRHIPLKFVLVLPLVAVRVAYGVASAFEWTISPLKLHVNNGWLYGLGYAPIILVLFIFNIWGGIDENEDRALITQRTARGRLADEELGLQNKKPAWWRHLRSGYTGNDPESRLKALTTEISGPGAAPGTANTYQRGLDSIEMGHITSPRGRTGSPPTPPPAYGSATNPFVVGDDHDGFDDAAVRGADAGYYNTQVPNLAAPAPTAVQAHGTVATADLDQSHLRDRSEDSAATAVSRAPQQKVRSMLDI